ncbi:protein kinase [Candidatus Sumerlaeota bacterium]|nr:protein kinase [Candidatus Sumerlaeota bacterium]
MSEDNAPQDKVPDLTNADSDAPTLSMPPKGKDPSGEKTEKSRLIGHYRIVRLLGRGGMGHVYLAVDTTLDRPVALKVVRSELTANPSNLERFRREARAVARLNHPQIVQIFEFGQHEGMPFYAMEYVEGKSLAAVLEERGPFPVGEAVALILGAVEALDYALGHNVVHRDIKPGNMLITRSGQFKLVDFGLSRCLEGDIDLTQSGTVIGSPYYMSPEQSKGEKADHRSDIYSLGVTFYHLLTGERPFEASSPLAVMLKHVQEPMPEPQILKKLLDGRVLPILAHMLAKNPDDRYQDYTELRRDLHRLVGTSGIPSGAGKTFASDETTLSRTVTTRGANASAPSKPSPSLLSLLLGVAAVVVLGLAGAGAILYWFHSRPESTERSSFERDGAPPSVGGPIVIAEVAPEATNVSSDSATPRTPLVPAPTASPTMSPRATATPPRGTEPPGEPESPLEDMPSLDEHFRVARNHIRSLQFDDAVAELDRIEREADAAWPGGSRLTRRIRPWRDLLVELDNLKQTVISAVNAPENRPFTVMVPVRRQMAIREATDEYLMIERGTGGPAQRMAWADVAPGTFCALAMRAVDGRPTPEQGRALVTLVRIFRLPTTGLQVPGVPLDSGQDPAPVQDLAGFVNQEKPTQMNQEEPIQRRGWRPSRQSIRELRPTPSRPSPSR